jgi:hypothetical protein
METKIELAQNAGRGQAKAARIQPRKTPFCQAKNDSLLGATRKKATRAAFPFSIRG